MSQVEELRGAFFAKRPRNPLREWWGECMCIDHNATELCMDVWQSLSDWCHRNGELALLAVIPDPSKLTRQLETNIAGLWPLEICRKRATGENESGMRYRKIRLKHRSTE